MTTHFTFFASYYDCLEGLEDEVKAEFLDIVCRYGLKDEVPKNMTPIAKALFSLAKPNLDKSKARREAGRAGGKQKKAKPKQNETKNKTSGPHNQSDKETELDKDNEKEPPPNTEEEKVERYINFSLSEANPRDPITYSLKIKNRISKQGGLSQADKEQLARFDKIDSFSDETKQKIDDYKKILSPEPSESLDSLYSMAGESDKEFRDRIKSESNSLLYN